MLRSARMQDLAITQSDERPADTRSPRRTCDTPRGCATLWERQDEGSDGGPLPPADAQPRRRAIGSAGERLVHTEEVTGSIPVSPTDVKPVQRLHGQLRSYAPDESCHRIGSYLGDSPPRAGLTTPLAEGCGYPGERRTCCWDGQHNGRYRWEQLHKTEKTHAGTLVEIALAPPLSRKPTDSRPPSRCREAASWPRGCVTQPPPESCRPSWSGGSRMALTHRLYELNLLTEWGYRAICVQLSRPGYRRPEPDGISRESSQLLSKVFRSVREKGRPESGPTPS
jgi:hypothetical protein